MFGKGGEVFVVPTQWGQRKPKRPTHKDPGEREREREREKPKGILLRGLNNGGMQGSHGHGRVGLTCDSHGWRTREPWMIRWGYTVSEVSH